MAEFPLDSGSPFSSSAQALAALSAFNKSTCCNGHIKQNESTSNPPTHLIGLYEASKYWEKHGRLCSFGILPKILHRRTVGLLNRERHGSVKQQSWPQSWLDARLQTNLCRLAVFGQSFQKLTVGFDKVLQHRAVILHEEFLFGHFHPPF